MVFLCVKQVPVRADLASPLWFDSDWHYRVPVTINSGSTGDTILHSITYADLLSDISVTGTFDVNSVRLTRANATSLVVQQSFTDNGADGDLEFVIEDDSPVTYYLYFDITENSAGNKPVLSSTLNAEWYDDDWQYRIPITIDNSTNSNALSEYQIKLEIDNTLTDFWANVDADGADVRVVEADGIVEDYFIESFDDSSQEAVIWVQIDGDIPANDTKTVYLYYGNASATSDSAELATFSYRTAKPTKYVLHGNLSTVSVVSYANGNRITHSTDTDCTTGTTVNVGEGDTDTFSSVGQDDIFCAKKPFSARGTEETTDALVPISFASTDFVLPTDRNTNVVSIISPFGPASVSVYTGTSEVTGSPFSVGSSAVDVTADSSGNSIVISSNIPVLVTHYSSSYDAFVAYGATTEDLYGVASNYAYLGYITDSTSGSALTSTGSTIPFSGNTGEKDTLISGAGTQGSGPAFVVSTNEAIGIVQEADSDGGEATVFLPLKELDTLYYLPTAAQYIAISCPTVGTSVSINDGAETGTCSGTNVGKLLFNAGYSAGTKVEADDPIYVYYEDSTRNDETNVWGMKAHRQMTYPEPSISFGSETSLLTDTTAGTAEGFGIEVDTVVEVLGGGALRCSDTAKILSSSDVGMYLDDSTGNTIEATIVDLDTNTYTATLYDDGAQGGDVTAGDGVYTNTNSFSVPALATGGVWSITIKAGSLAGGYDNGYVTTDVESFTVVCSYQPDAQIKLSGDGSYVGSDDYYPTDQERSSSLDNGATATYELLIENDGAVSDDFTITGTATTAIGGGTFTVQYIGTDGSTDVTTQVIGSGYSITSVAAGASETMTVKVTPSLAVVDGTEFDVNVTATSGTNVAAFDVVSASTSVSAEDDDSDGLTNTQEVLIGTNPADADSDDDYIQDGEEVDDVDNPLDTDADGTINALDADSDADGISDATEAGDTDLTTTAEDTDEDGVPDYRDTDSDGDTVLDITEGTGDDDGDGVLNYQDADDEDGPNGDQDLDGLSNADEVTLGIEHDDADSDDDTISDGDETPDPDNAPDTDFDGTINALDFDSDGDTILDRDEAGDTDLSTPPVDTDEDGTPDYLDIDSDGDGTRDYEEAGDALLQTSPLDSDADGIPDFQDTADDSMTLEQETDSGDDQAVETDGASNLDGFVSGGCSLRVDSRQ